MTTLPEIDFPMSFDLDLINGMVTQYTEMVQRRVSDMQMMFFDKSATQKAIQVANPVVYEFNNNKFVTSSSDMAIAITRIFPGKIGDEYYMSKGHQHQRMDQPEIYICIKGHGYLLLDTFDGEFRAEPWKPGTITHIPPMWAHRAVNTSSETMIYIGVYHVSAGHDYSMVAARGFSRVVIEKDGHPAIIPHP
jgi:glucose-6-phosphate isomerase